MNHSYWEVKQFFTNTDFVIIGSGIVGLSTAINLRERHPKAKILIIEKGYLPAGASSKNAGFACFGSPSEILSDLKSNTTEEIISLVEMRKKGLETLLKTCGKKQIDYLPLGSYELFTKKENQLFKECEDKIAFLNKTLYPIFKDNVYKIDQSAISEFGFKGVENLIKNKFEGQIDTGKMITKLLNIVRSLNIEILNGIEMERFIDNSNNCEVILKNGFSFKTNQLIIATNGFAKALLPNLDIEPARAQVLITKPIENLKIKGTFHLEEGYYYFRNINDRVLIGGGRNLDFKGETTSKLETTTLIQEKLANLLKDTILPNSNFEIDYSWAGIMGVGSIKRPLIGRHSPHVSYGIRMGGMGVAIGSLIGVKIANLLA